MKKTLHLVLGSIGSGKSRICAMLLSQGEFNDVKYIGSDEFKKKYFNEITDVFDARRSRCYRCADELAFSEMEKLCKRNESLVYEFCPTNRNKLETIKQIVKKYDYKVIGYFIGTDSDKINIDRVQVRYSSGGDAVKIGKIKRRWKDALYSVLELAVFADEMVFFDNSKDNESPQVIASLKNRRIGIDKLMIYLEKPPQWFEERIMNIIIK